MLAEERGKTPVAPGAVDPDCRLHRLRASRKRLRAGDVFCVLPEDGRYVFGRVIEVEMPYPPAPTPNSNLIYIYDHRSDAKEPPPRERLTPDRLLIGPMFINRLGWSRGYIETVGHYDPEPGDRLEQHCFHDYYKGFVDERGEPLLGPVEPCGFWGLSGYMALGERVNEALGMTAW
jgi:hypothetical protein